MKVKCLKSFATSKLSTYKGQEIEITDQEVLNDLLVGYVESIEESEAAKKTTRKKVVKDESK